MFPILIVFAAAHHLGPVGSTPGKAPEEAGPFPSSRSREWGVNAHFGRTGGAMDTLLTRVATAYATVRLDMSWGVVETAKGEYDGFGFYDA